MAIRQVHCFIDCIAHVLKDKPDVDIRPLYFGVWDSPFAISEDGVLSYYSHTIGCEDDTAQLYDLYGVKMKNWYNYAESKACNYSQLKIEAGRPAENREVIVLVNLFYLPYPNGCHQVSHRPHFVLVNHGMEGAWQLRDPYFAWEGMFPDQVLSRSFFRKENFAGYSFNSTFIRQPSPEKVGIALKKRLNRFVNPLSAAVRMLVQQAVLGGAGASIKRLSVSLEQLGVIAKRKQSYALAFAYFAEKLQDDPKDLVARVDELVKGWINLAFLIIRLSIAGRPEDSVKILDKITVMDEEERRLKEELWFQCERWAKCHE